MKLSLILTFSLVFITSLFYSQKTDSMNSNARSLNTPERNLPVIKKDSTPSQKINTQSKSSAEDKWTIESLDKYIAALEKKRAWIQNNPDEDAKAKASGWYEKTEQYLKNARLKRELLIKNKQ